MVQNNHYSVSDLENMYPYERDIFVGMINRDNEINQQQQQQMK